MTLEARLEFRDAPSALLALLKALLPSHATSPRTQPPDGVDLDAWVSEVTHRAGFASEEVRFYDENVAAMAQRDVPFVFVPAGRNGVAYAVLGGREGSTRFASTDGTVVAVPTRAAQTIFVSGNEENVRARARLLLNERHPAKSPVESALMHELRKSTPLGWGFALRPNVGDSVRSMLRGQRLGASLGKVLLLSALQSLLVTLSWAAIGSLSLSGRAARGSLIGWALLSATATLAQLVATRFVGHFTIRSATALRQRLLEGALGLSPEALGHYGLGGLMVVAAQADSFVGALIALVVALLGVLTNAVSAIAVLLVAPLPVVTLGSFAFFVVGALATLPFFAKRTAALQLRRIELTTDIVERMVGHRTRLIQQTASGWHDGEDEPLLRYAEETATLDRWTTRLNALPRLHYLLSLAIVFSLLVARPTADTLAISLGGMILSMATLGTVVAFVRSSAELYALWQAIRPIVDDVEQPPEPDADVELEAIDRELEKTENAKSGASPIIELRNVSFAYPRRSQRVFEAASMKVLRGERVLVEGRSGGGKTTLAALLTGLRQPDAGVVLVRGLDQHTITESELRRTIAAAPQFYKNHIFAQSLAFNLLMGRRWPPTPADLRDALKVTRALGLGPLLERMPSGLFQFVGDTGWQLSHGEKSRVYLARTLLQPHHVMILDETLGALDPDTLQRCLGVVLDRAPTLVVITHR